MILAVQVFGFLLALTGLIILVNPMTVFGPLGRNIGDTGLRVLAVVVRTLLGVLLIVTSEQSRYPLLMEWLGGLSVAAALFLLLMGRERFERLMRWALGLVDRLGRVAGVTAIAFGGFLLYAYY